MTLLEFWRAGFIALHVALKGLLKDTLYLVFKDRFTFNESRLRCPGFDSVARQATFSRPKQNVTLTHRVRFVKRVRL